MYTGNQPNLAQINQAQLLALSQQGNNTLTHKALIEQASAQAAMQEASQKTDLQVPKVNFYPTRHPNPMKEEKTLNKHTSCLPLLKEIYLILLGYFLVENIVIINKAMYVL